MLGPLSLRPLYAALSLSACVLLVLSCGGGSRVAAQTATVFAATAGPDLLAMDSAGFIYASSSLDSSVLKFNSALQEVGRFSIAGINNNPYPLGVAVVGTSLFVADERTFQLVEFSTIDGSLLATHDLGALGIIYPIGLAVAADQQSLYLLDVNPNPITRFSLNGTLLQTFNTSAELFNGFDNAQTISVDQVTGYVYVACYEYLLPSYALNSGEVFEFTADGALLQIINISTYNEGPVPEGLAIAANGTELIVVDSVHLAVTKYRISDGAILWNTSTLLSAMNGYNSIPQGALVDPTSSFVYVSDLFNARIYQYDFNTGALLNTYNTSTSTLYGPSSLTLVGSTLYVTGGPMGYIVVLDQAGIQTGEIYLDTTDQFATGALASDAEGFIYVADGATSSVSKLSADGTIVQVFNTTAPALGLFTSSYNMAVAPNGDLYVSDADNTRIVHFAASGDVLLTFHSSTGDNGFSPIGLGLLPNGQLAAVDGANARVVIFDESGVELTSLNYTGSWQPQGLVVGTSTAGVVQIFVSDSQNSQVVVFSPAGAILRTLIANSPPLTIAAGLALSATGDLYLADADESRIFVFRNALTGPSAVIGDPQFVGLRGQSFQVHGIDGAVYALVSSVSTQVNARFVFLDSGSCPSAAVITTQCWSHPGSYLGAVAIQERVDGHDVQRLVVEAGAHEAGFVSVQLNGRSLAVGDSASVGQFAVQVLSSHRLVVRTRELQLTLDNSDRFINQQVEALVGLTRMTAHGLLGQTHRAVQHKSALRHIEGDVDEYVVSDLLAHDFHYDRFEQRDQ